MKCALVTTTINVPVVLEQYAADIAEHGPADVTVIVVGDRKTPLGAKDFCADLGFRTGVSIVYLGVDEQGAFLSHFPDYARFLPWNCIQRRNVALLKAYIEGADVIYTIDDDNYPCKPTYLASHGVLGVVRPLQVIQTDSGWYNVCDYLEERRSHRFFPRGFSMRQRACSKPIATTRSETGRVIVNAGLWVGDPDVDAVTRLAIAPDVTGCTLSGHIALGQGTISPFNSQNTAVHREAIPAYSMHVGVGRYDDIIPSYIVKRIADHLGDYISFGEPIVRQVRNSHDLWQDVDAERVGMSLIDDIVDVIYGAPLRGASYAECVGDLLAAIADLSKRRGLTTPRQRDFLTSIVQNNELWLGAIARC